MDYPSGTSELVVLLDTLYPDKIGTDPKIVGTPEYWKQVGVIELIQKIKYQMRGTNLKNVSA